MAEDEMVGWHHRLNGHEFEQTPGNGEGHGTLHASVHGVTKSQIRLSDFIFTLYGCESWTIKKADC